MQVKNLLNKRILITERSGFGNGSVVEVKILEISPSENWAKIMNMHGKKHWKPITDISVVEVLKTIEKPPKV